MVLQMVILRDGLLVGTEVFVPGTYLVGSSSQADVKLDDGQVAPEHARILFKDGRMAIQDRGARNTTLVNGHPVTSCEIRAQDEVLIGPFVLKARVISRQSKSVEQPPEVQAVLRKASQSPSRSPPPPPQITLPRIPAAASKTPMGLAQDMSGTIPSTRRRNGPTLEPELTLREELRGNAAVARSLPTPQRPKMRSASPKLATPKKFDFLPWEDTKANSPALRPGPPRLFQVPTKGKGKPRLFVEVYWGNARQTAASFRPTVKKPLVAGGADAAGLPLHGFSLPEGGFTFAEPAEGGRYRVFVPPKMQAQQRRKDGDFTPVQWKDQDAARGRRALMLAVGNAVRLTEGEMSMFVYVAPRAPGVFVNPLARVPWLALVSLAMCSAAAIWFAFFGPGSMERPDFIAMKLNPVAIRLMMPQGRPKPKKPEAKPQLAKQEAAPEPKPEARPEPRPEPRPRPKRHLLRHEKAVVQAAPEAPPQPKPDRKVFNALAKLSAAGPAMKDMLAAVDKLGNGPGSKTVKNTNFKLAGLIGRAPIANAGLGTFGLGGSGRNGGATLGAELLHGRGGGGIGALGAGSLGRGRVGGTVSQATARAVTAQGNIDREAVARAVNSHLQEVRACYERALLHNSGLAGKVVLEWTISTSGRVVAAKTRSSTLREASVESCILQTLKTWQFPVAKGGVVIVSYPFLFNAVGF